MVTSAESLAVTRLTLAVLVAVTVVVLLLLNELLLLQAPRLRPPLARALGRLHRFLVLFLFADQIRVLLLLFLLLYDLTVEGILLPDESWSERE